MPGERAAGDPGVPGVGRLRGCRAKAISLGGDSDTLACLAGGIAQAFYGGVPETISLRVYEILDDHLGGLARKFTEAFGCL